MVHPRRILSQTIKYLVLAIGAAVCLLPILWQIRSSFMSITEIFQVPLVLISPQPVAQNYADVFTMVPFATYYLNTVIIVVLNVVGALISNVSIAYAFARLNFKGKKFMFGFSMLTLMLPASVQLFPFFLEWKFLGGINTFLPLTVLSFFGSAFFIFLLVQFFRAIPVEFDEAAFVDGANYPQIILKIIVPLAKPALAVLVVFQFLNVWNDFLSPLLYLNDSSLYTLAVGLRSFMSAYSTPWPQIMAAATLMIAPLILVFFAAQRYFIQGLTMGGVKG